MKLMSFALTTDALLAGRKDVTRRAGWLDAKPGDVVCAVDRLPRNARGEWKRLGKVTFLDVAREPLRDGLRMRAGANQRGGDVAREGFGDMHVGDFVEMFCKANGCAPDDTVTRIAFRFEVFVDGEGK